MLRAIALAACFIPPAPALAGVAPEPSPFAGLKVLRLQVAQADPDHSEDPGRDGANAKLREEIAARLRAAGLAVVPEEQDAEAEARLVPKLSVRVALTPVSFPGMTCHAFVRQVELLQRALLDRDPALEADAVTWSRVSADLVVGVFSKETVKDASLIMKSGLHALLQEFLSATGAEEGR